MSGDFWLKLQHFCVRLDCNSLLKPFVLTDFVWHFSRQGGKGGCLTTARRLKTQVQPFILSWYLVAETGRGVFITLGIVQFPDPHVVSSDTIVDGGCLVPLGSGLVWSQFGEGGRRRDASWLGVGGSPGSSVVSRHCRQCFVIAGMQKGSGSLLGPLWHHSLRGVGLLIRALWDVWSPHSAFVGLGGHSFFCGVCLELEQFSSKSSLFC